MACSVQVFRAAINLHLSPGLNGVICSSVDNRTIRGDFLHRRLGSNGRHVSWFLSLIGFGDLRHDADDGEGVGHLIALQDVVAVRFWREDDVLVADGCSDLHLGAFGGLH